MKKRVSWGGGGGGIFGHLHNLIINYKSQENSQGLKIHQDTRVKC